MRRRGRPVSIDRLRQILAEYEAEPPDIRRSGPDGPETPTDGQPSREAGAVGVGVKSAEDSLADRLKRFAGQRLDDPGVREGVIREVIEWSNEPETRRALSAMTGIPERILFPGEA